MRRTADVVRVAASEDLKLFVQDLLLLKFIEHWCIKLKIENTVFLFAAFFLAFACVIIVSIFLMSEGLTPAATLSWLA